MEFLSLRGNFLKNQTQFSGKTASKENLFNRFFLYQTYTHVPEHMKVLRYREGTLFPSTKQNITLSTRAVLCFCS